MDSIRFSIIIRCHDTNRAYYRAALESLVATDYMEWELVVLDENYYSDIEAITMEFFPEDKRARYYRIRKNRGMAYAYNMALHYCRGEYMVFVGEHDVLSPNALLEYDNEINVTNPDIIYCDHDELIGSDRMNPALKPGINKELLRHVNYIGNHIVIKKRAFSATGTFRETLDAACIYDILLRAVEKNLIISHIASLLYHVRIQNLSVSKQDARHINEKIYREHLTVAGAHLRREGIEASLIPDKRLDFWKIKYEGSDYRLHRREFVCMRERKCKVITKRALEKLYGHIRQPDVGVVGVTILKNRLTIDNCGFIFDKEGIAYPACHGHGVFYEGYMGRSALAQDVSMIDPAYCVIDKKVYKRLGGFKAGLIGRDRMLDFCFRVKRAGFRVVFEPGVKAIKRQNENLSSQESNSYLMEVWGDIIQKGDPYYNRNLPMGLENYFLY